MILYYLTFKLMTCISLYRLLPKDQKILANISSTSFVLGMTLNCLFDNSLTTTTLLQHDRYKKTDLYESFDSKRTQLPRQLAVCVRTHAVMQDCYFNLVSCTPLDLTTRLTANDARYLESGIGTRQQREFEADTVALLTLYTVEEPLA